MSSEESLFESPGESPSGTDDLTRIQGISPAIERQLHDVGILTYAQLAALSLDQIAQLVENLPLLSIARLARLNWPGQARALAMQSAQGAPGDRDDALEASPRYATFTIDLLLDDLDQVRQTRITHAQDGAEAHWGGWNADDLLRFMAARAAISSASATVTSAPGPGANHEYSQKQPTFSHIAADESAVAAEQIAALTPAVDTDDDLPISSEQLEIDNARLSAHSYGAMGAPSPPPDNLERDREGADQGGIAPLDAWYAAYGHPAITALLRRPELAAAVVAPATSADDRTQVAPTEAYPWRCICLLHITAADGSRWIGTGWLAGPRTVITAGHCVYLHRHGGWVRQIEVAPGQDGDLLPYGVTIATSFRSVWGWARSRLPGYNYGAIILPADRAFGNLLGFFGSLNASNLDLQAANINLAGYPCDRPHATQWHHQRRLDFLTPRTLEYAIDTIGGQSGAPAWIVRRGAPYVVGIHTNGDRFGNSATRISAPVFENISAWKREGS